MHEDFSSLARDEIGVSRKGILQSDEFWLGEEAGGDEQA